MSAPIISFMCFERACLTAKNLTALLNTNEDFELYIVDNASTDDTWKFIEQLKDERIKCKKRFEKNRFVVYSMNYVLSHRKKNQYFIHIDNDVEIKTNDFIHRFMRIFYKFPELGLLGAISDVWFEDYKKAYNTNILPELVTKDGLSYYDSRTVIGCCFCVRPEVFDHIGYFNEETNIADSDFMYRVNKFTPYKTGIIPNIKLDQIQSLHCHECMMRDLCSITDTNCTIIYQKRRFKNKEYADFANPRNVKYLKEITDGIRTAYCASIHDPISMQNHYYDRQRAEENFSFFVGDGFKSGIFK